MSYRERTRRYLWRSAVELASSLFIVLFPYSAVSLVLVAQDTQSPWSNIAVAAVLGGGGSGGDAVLVHLPVEAERYESGVAVLRADTALDAAPLRAAPITAGPRTAVAIPMAETAPAAVALVAPSPPVAARRLTTAGDVTPIDPLEPVVTRSGNSTILVASKP